MNWEEFEQKVGNVLSNYGFTYSEAMIYWCKSVRHIWTNSSMMPGKPDAIFEYTYDENHRNIYITYNSIMYHYSPSGQHSITGKNYDQRFKETDIKKFKWETLEKWAKGQLETVSMARKLYKEYEIEKKDESGRKGFQVTYEEHFKFFFKNNPNDFTRDEIEASRNTKPIIMYIDNNGKIQQTISTRSWLDISIVEADLLLKKQYETN